MSVVVFVSVCAFVCFFKYGWLFLSLFICVWVVVRVSAGMNVCLYVCLFERICIYGYIFLCVSVCVRIRVSLFVSE